MKKFLLMLISVAALLSACGGGGDEGAGAPGTPNYTVGGTVAGLTGIGLVLQNSGSDDKAITANGSFTFATGVANASPYAVTVLTQPAGQTCAVTNGTGTIAGANVANVQVVCASAYTVGGTVTGVTGTLVLQNNGADDKTITADGTFAFSTSITDISEYVVTVKTQPTGQVCMVSNGVGTVQGANITNVVVTCITTVSVIPLAYGSLDLPVSGSLGAEGMLFHVTGLGTDASLYTVGVDFYGGLSPNAGLYVFLDSAFTQPACGGPLPAGATRIGCDAQPSINGDLFVMVVGTGASFTLDVLPVVVAPPVTPIVPTPTTLNFGVDLPYSANVASTEGTYLVTGLTAGSVYTVSMASLSGAADMGVFNDPAFTQMLCIKPNAGVNSESCAATANAAGELYVLVYTASATTFLLDVVPATPVPVDATLTIANLPLNDSVGNGTIFYRVTGLPVGSFWAIDLTALSDDADLYVYADDLQTMQCLSLELGTTPETCFGYANDLGELFIEVAGFYTVAGATFNLSVTPAAAPIVKPSTNALKPSNKLGKLRSIVAMQ